MRLAARQITGMAMLIALHIIFTRFFSIHIPFGGVDGIRLGFGSLPLVLCGILFGSKHGFFAGVVGDLVGFALYPTGLFVPTFTVAAGLYGFLSGIISSTNEECGLSWRVYLGIVISQIVVALLVIPALLKWHFGLPFWVTMPMRLVTQAILIPSYCAFVYVVWDKVRYYEKHQV